MEGIKRQERGRLNDTKRLSAKVISWQIVKRFKIVNLAWFGYLKIISVHRETKVSKQDSISVTIYFLLTAYDN